MITFRIVIVDDDIDDRDLLRDAFEKTGIEPVLAVEAAEGLFSYLQGIRNDKDLPSLIVTDMNMPGTTGIEVLKALKGMARYAHIPVVVWSTSTDKKDMGAAKLFGAQEYFIKPLLLEDYYKISKQLKVYTAA